MGIAPPFRCCIWNHTLSLFASEISGAYHFWYESDTMTTPTPMWAEYAAAETICALPKATYSLAEIAGILAAPRAEPTADPAQAHAAELETALRWLAEMAGYAAQHIDENWYQRNGIDLRDAIDQANVLLATLERERKAVRP